LGTTVSENGGATLDVSSSIQDAQWAFTKLQKVWQSTLMNRHKDKSFQCLCFIWLQDLAGHKWIKKGNSNIY
jgi:hypothetical protein